VRTIEELSLEFVPHTFKRYFQNFLLKANQQFVEILSTTYIFQSRSIYNSRQSCVINQEALRTNILMCKWYPAISPTSRFANVSFANVLGQFANVLSRFANVLLVNSPTSK